MKIGGNLKKTLWRKFSLLEKNSMEMNTKYLLRKLRTLMMLNRCLLLTQLDKWLVKNSGNTHWTWRRGRYSSIKTFHFGKLLNVIFWNWIYVMQSWNISASYEIVMHSQSQRFFIGSTNQFRTWKLFTKVFHTCVILVKHLGSYFQ